ncbi:MAG: aldo/keto reductase [Chloroflexota bacterium]|nr:aldo/keto reductase [Chloroflexota bacterium]
MEYRKLGKTGLEVSILSFGASSLGSVFRPIDDDEGIRALHVALDLGVNLIDCSPFYGITTAERVLGKALRGVPRDKYVLATKVGRYGEEEFDFSAERVTASVDESLGRLGLEHIDIIQCHDIEYASLDQIVDETIPALRRVQETGKARFVGITGFPLAIYPAIMDRIEVDTILSYAHYSLNDATLAGLIPYLREKDVGIIGASPLSMGLLTNRGTPDWHPATDEIKAVCAAAAAFCREQGIDIAQLAVQFSLRNREIHSTLIGTANPDNMRRNVEWLDAPYDEALIAAALDVLAPIRDKTWQTGLPENN